MPLAWRYLAKSPLTMRACGHSRSAWPVGIALRHPNARAS